MIFVKNSRGGREVNMINTLSKKILSKIGWEGGREVNLNLDNVFKYTVFVLEITPNSYYFYGFRFILLLDLLKLC